MAVATDDLLRLVDFTAGTVSGRAFASEPLYDLELERVFARAWVYLCDTADIPEPGEFLTTFTGEDPVAIVRQPDGTLRAMLNSCRHRGLPVCGLHGQAPQLTCGYHGWIYALDGRLVGALDGDPEFDRWAADRQLALVAITATDEIGDLLFGTWDGATAPLSDPHLLRVVDALEVVRGGTPLRRHPRPVGFDADWKLVVEALGSEAASAGPGVVVFPSFVVLPARRLVVAVHPKGPGRCELWLSATEQIEAPAIAALRASLEARMQDKRPRGVPLSLRSTTADPGCPADDTPLPLPAHHLENDHGAALYRQWLDLMLDDRPLSGLPAR